LGAVYRQSRTGAMGTCPEHFFSTKNMDRSLSERLAETVGFLKSRITVTPELAVVLGSGLSSLAGMIASPIVIPYNEIPHFSISTVDGHAGHLVVGQLEGKGVLCMNGRFHFYEGYSLEAVTYPIRVIQQLGATRLILTNAAGGINKGFIAGDLMIINDHLNFMGGNPLTGPNDDTLGPRFPDMSEAYSARLRDIARETGRELGINLRMGIYAALPGPSYETPAEIRMLRTCGADAVGMSTVPETIVARHMGMEVLAVSCITNPAAGVGDRPLSHEEVKQTAARIQDHFSRLIARIIDQC
jgi:purine-nucleoside phosphorylase